MSVQAPSRLRLTLFHFKEVATGEPQVLAEVAEYVAVVFGFIAAWMSWLHSRRR
jgi:hypothetical protein